MNARQAAKAAAERIKECERVMALNKADIIDYNKVIADMICGESPCPWCEDWEECKLEAKGGKGCSEWMLRHQTFTQTDVKEEADESKGLHVTGAGS